MKLHCTLMLVFFSFFSCSKEVIPTDIASNLVGDYQGVLVDEMENIIDDNIVVSISKISNDVIKVEPKTSTSQITNFQVNIIKNSNVITNLVNNSDVIMVIDLSKSPFEIGIDYSDSKKSFTGIKIN